MDKPVSFRPAIGPILLFAVVSTGLVAILSFPTDQFIPRHPNAVDIHWGWRTLAYGAVALVMAGIWFCFPVYVSESGIRSYNFWGKYGAMTWADMATVSPYSILWFHYLVVHNKNRATIYIPLFLSDQRRFNATVKERAGPENVLVHALGAYPRSASLLTL